MQTVETLNEGLKRAYTLKITAKDIDKKVDAEFQQIWHQLVHETEHETPFVGNRRSRSHRVWIAGEGGKCLSARSTPMR